MEYTLANPKVKGGFDYNLHFKWDFMTSKEMNTRNSPISPIRTPAIAGGLFAVDKEWFHHIGDYDNQMEIWGAENVGVLLPSPPLGFLSFYLTNFLRTVPQNLDVWGVNGNHPLFPRWTHFPVCHSLLIWGWRELSEHSWKVS